MFIADAHVIGESRADATTSGDGDSAPADAARAEPASRGASRTPVGWRTLVGVGLGLAALIAVGRQLNTRSEAGTSLPRSIAVLPFKPLVAGDVDERMQLGMTDALINQLSRTRRLRVEPLARVRRYGALGQDPVAAGRELAVDAAPGQVTIDGSATFDVRDWGLQPPRVALLQVHPEVEVRIHLVATSSPEPDA